MSATILPFPSSGPPRSRAEVRSSKMLIIKREGRRFAVVLHPILSDQERFVRETFGTIEVARAYARRIAAAYPQLYREVIDQTGGAT